MQAAMGKIVHFRGLEANGNLTHPAIITRVWGEGHYNGEHYITVNMTIFLDAEAPVRRTSVPLFQTERAGEIAGQRIYAFWPEVK